LAAAILAGTNQELGKALDHWRTVQSESVGLDPERQ